MKTIDDVIKELESLGFVAQSSMKETTKFVYQRLAYGPTLNFFEIKSHLWRWKYILNDPGKLMIFHDDGNTSELHLTDEMSIANIMVLYK